MRTYNITKNLNSYSGRNKYSIPIGTTRNIRGSANRIYQYCRRNSNDPFYCMFGIVNPSPPIKPCLNGYVSYSYTYTGSIPINDYIVSQNLPVYTITGILNTNPEITIVGNLVYVEITTCLYELPSYPNNVGISLTLNPQIPNYINNFTNGVTFLSSNNCPFAKSGSQFKGINNITFTTGTFFKPYFLPETSLAECFRGCTNFNSDISGWDTTNVTNMSSMFYSATTFNQPLNSWNTSNVTNMSSMFLQAASFNQPLNSWNTSNVTDMSSMFYLATTFNQPIDNLNVSKVTSMKNMFRQTTMFNQNIDSWNVSKVTTMENMFYLATSFDQPLNSWNTSNVTNMINMFRQATIFNQNIGSWNVSKVTNMENMFYIAQAFNNGGSPDIENWSAPLCTSFEYMFGSSTSNTNFNQPLTKLVDTSGLSDGCNMGLMFYLSPTFNQNIGSWNVSKATNMNNMFNQAISFNNGGSQDIQSWSAP